MTTGDHTWQRPALRDMSVDEATAREHEAIVRDSIRETDDR